MRWQGRLVTEFAIEVFLVFLGTGCDNGFGVVDCASRCVDLETANASIGNGFCDDTTLLPQRCAEGLQGHPVSTLVLTGRDPVLTQPGGVVPSPLVVEQARDEQTTVTVKKCDVN